MVAEHFQRLPGLYLEFEYMFSFSLSIHRQYFGRHSSILLSSGRQMGIKQALGPLQNLGARSCFMQQFCRDFPCLGFIGGWIQPALLGAKKNQRHWSLGIPSPRRLFPKQNVNNFIVSRIYSCLLPCVIQPKERRAFFLSS